MDFIIKKDISKRILMTGVKYKDNHPGGISSVVSYWSEYFEKLNYYATFKETGFIGKVSLYVLTYIKIFIKLLFDSNIEIIHCHTAADNDFKRNSLIIKLAKIFKKKIILHSHASRFKDFYTDSSTKKRNWILSTLNDVDVLIVLSESWKDWFENIGVDSKKITILHNITRHPLILDNYKSNIYYRPLHLLFLGEIGPRKGIFDILSVISKQHDNLVNKIELRVGGNKMETELLNVIKTEHISDIVKYEGWVKDEKKIELLNWADIYILPSYNEGLPISILEAMSYGMPIISTPVGGIPEVVDKENGILIAPGNHDGIYNAISFYINDRKSILSHGRKSLERIKSYLPEMVMHNLMDIYLSLLKL